MVKVDNRNRRSAGTRERPARKNVSLASLTLRERDIVRKLAQSDSNKEIAVRLGVSASTIAVHIKNIYKKLGVHSRREAIAAVAAFPAPSLPVRWSGASAKQYILALDQGTVRSCAIVFDQKGTPVSFAQKRLDLSYPRPGWVEHDGLSLWSSQAGVAAEAIVSAGLSGSQIAAVGLSNQRATVLVWDRVTGKPICPAILWQDRRTAAVCERLKSEGRIEWIRTKTGLVPDPYFSATKIQWILDHVKGARRMAEAGRLLFGTVDAWLVWNCTRGAVHVTDASNASHTMLYNIRSGAWDRELLDFFGIPDTMMPQIRPSCEVYGETHLPFFAAGVPVAAVVGDQQAAMFGQRCVTPGMVKCTFGKGCFAVMNTGTRPVPSAGGLLTTVAWQIGAERTYALEGNIFVAGDVIDWLRDGLGLVRKVDDAEALAKSVPDNGGVYFVPAFDGLGAPHGQLDARGTLVGLTRNTVAGHIARAALEGIAFQTRDALKAMEADAGIPVTELRADGEGTSNALLMQFQSDILGVPLSLPKATETRALGAAYLAGLAVGYWPNQRAIDTQWRESRRFKPAMQDEDVRRLTAGWRRALKAASVWAG
jgi:glycerol kinase